ncbi:MAG: hypothetical protein AAF292_01000 [Pseudomonadota bacterium]
MIKYLIATALVATSACAHTKSSDQTVFFETLLSLCQQGEAYPGRVVSTDEADATFAEETLIAHFRSCSANEIRIPFHVGEDRSRTWVITPTEAGLRLKHDHRHEDGLEDTITQYGGDTLGEGDKGRQEFPADEFSKGLFLREGLDVSVDNVWAVEIDTSVDLFAYELSRPNRFFRVEFDLANPVDVPPPPWGAE